MSYSKRRQRLRRSHSIYAGKSSRPDGCVKVYRKSPARASSAGAEERGVARRPSLDHAHARGESAKLAIEEVVAQRARDSPKCELAPGHVVLLEQPHFQALRTRPEVRSEPRPEHHVHLADLRKTDHCVQLVEF